MEDQALKKERATLIDKAAESKRALEASRMSIDQLRAEFGEPAKEKNSKPQDLMLLPIERIRAMNAKSLRAICKDNDMSVDGKREDFLNRVLAIRFGRVKRYIGPETRCQICGAEVMVKGKTSTTRGDGRIIVVRSIRCKGKHAHTYPLTEIL